MLTRIPLLAMPALALATGSAMAVTLTADKDTYVDFANPDTSFGSSETLLVTTLSDNANQTDNDEGKSKTIFISFDLSSITGPYTSATLDILKLDGRGDRNIELWGVTDESFDAWDESSLTWNAAVADNVIVDNDGRSLVNEVRLGLLMSATPTRNDGVDPYTAFDDTTNMTDELLDFVNSDTNGIVTFAVHFENVNGNIYSFASSESTLIDAFAPTLTLTPIPEPASVAALGLLGLVGLRRRR
jgi:hypothetical protein